MLQSLASRPVTTYKRQKKDQLIRPGYIFHIWKLASFLKQAVNLARLGINIDIEVARGSRQTGNGLDVGSQSVQVPSASSHAHVPDRHREARRGALEVRVVAERILRLSDANR